MKLFDKIANFFKYADDKQVRESRPKFVDESFNRPIVGKGKTLI